jgi:hypothetical protein
VTDGFSCTGVEFEWRCGRARQQMAIYCGVAGRTPLPLGDLYIGTASQPAGRRLVLICPSRPDNIVLFVSRQQFDERRTTRARTTTTTTRRRR